MHSNDRMIPQVDHSGSPGSGNGMLNATLVGDEPVGCRVSGGRRGHRSSPGWAPCPRSPGHTGRWCDHWRIYHSRRCCGSPSWSTAWGSARRSTVTVRNVCVRLYVNMHNIVLFCFFFFVGQKLKGSSGQRQAAHLSDLFSLWNLKSVPQFWCLYTLSCQCQLLCSLLLCSQPQLHWEQRYHTAATATLSLVGTADHSKSTCMLCLFNNLLLSVWMTVMSG